VEEVLLTPLQAIYLLIIGLSVGFTGALFGVGGGFVLVPLLTFVLGVNAHSAIGTSLAAILFTGFFSAAAYFRQGRIDWKLALLMETSTMPGAFTGAFLTTCFSSRTMKILLAAVLVFLAASILSRRETINPPTERRHEKGKLTWGRRIIDSKGQEFIYSIDIPKAISAGFIAGLASGFFGIGGGVIKVPVLYHLSVPIHVAIATSTFMITLTAFSATVGHALLRHVMWPALLGIVPGILLGTQIGAKTSRRIKSKNLRKAFSAILIVMAILLLAR